MRLRPRFALALIVLFWVPTVRAQEKCDQELLLNPGCEEPLAGGEIPEWTEMTGRSWTVRFADPPPSPDGGTGYFSPGSTISMISELYQKQFLSPDSLVLHNSFVWGAEIWTSAETPANTAWIQIAARDAVSSVLLLHDTGDITTGGKWERIGGTFSLPMGARSIEMWLICFRQTGTEYNVYFDNLYLAHRCSTPVRPATWGQLKALFKQ
jgi:hypothetical protein